MSYLKNWRKYRAEAEAIAKTTDDEFSSNSNQERHFEINAEHEDDNTNNSEIQNADVNEVIATPDQNSFFLIAVRKLQVFLRTVLKMFLAFSHKNWNKILHRGQQKTNAQDQL